MRTYLEYHAELDGFQNVLETVATVEKVAASSLHLLKQQTQAFRNYRYEVGRLLVLLRRFYPAVEHPLLQARGGGRLLVLLSGDKGLAGGFYHNLLELFFRLRPGYQHLVAVGAKGARLLAEEGVSFEQVLPTLGESAELRGLGGAAAYLLNRWRQGGLAAVDVLYPKFVSLTEQRAVTAHFLPFQLEAAGGPAEGLPIFDSPKPRLFEWFLEKYAGCFFSGLQLEARLSELSARTVAMEHASATTKRLIHALRFDYFKLRRKTATERLAASFSIPGHYGT